MTPDDVAVGDVSDVRKVEPLGRVKAGAQDEPWRTPFAPGAIPIAEPVLPPPPPPRGVVEGLLVLIPLVVVMLAAGFVSLALGGRWGLRGTVVTAVVVAGWLAILEEVRGERRGSDTRPVAIVVLVVGTLAVPATAYFYGVTSAFLGLVMVGAAAVAWRSVAARDAADQRARDARVDLAANYQHAVEWNRVRDALRTPGSRAERSMGPPCLDEPFRVRTVDPATGDDTLRDLDVELPRNGWVVVDEAGSAICTASPGSLEGWLATWPEAATSR